MPGKSHIIPLMEEEMTLFKSLVPPGDRAKGPFHPDTERTPGGFADSIAADV